MLTVSRLIKFLKREPTPLVIGATYGASTNDVNPFRRKQHARVVDVANGFVKFYALWEADGEPEKVLSTSEKTFRDIFKNRCLTIVEPDTTGVQQARSNSGAG